MNIAFLMGGSLAHGEPPRWFDGAPEHQHVLSEGRSWLRGQRLSSFLQWRLERHLQDQDQWLDQRSITPGRALGVLQCNTTVVAWLLKCW